MEFSYQLSYYLHVDCCETVPSPPLRSSVFVYLSVLGHENMLMYDINKPRKRQMYSLIKEKHLLKLTRIDVQNNRGRRHTAIFLNNLINSQQAALCDATLMNSGTT